ncbi:hypothetical protein BaRGS_00009454 [Batillaria attramentaria]|uniref:Secreted protein n=1 Tax=Batillaria attramentaria TaxID=370345 RepID=A0ABD0LJP3_9CAEN
MAEKEPSHPHNFLAVAFCCCSLTTPGAICQRISISDNGWSLHIILVQSESNGAQVTWTVFVACRLLVEQPPVVRHCSEARRLSDFSAENRRFTRSVTPYIDNLVFGVSL